MTKFKKYLPTKLDVKIIVYLLAIVAFLVVDIIVPLPLWLVVLVILLAKPIGRITLYTVDFIIDVAQWFIWLLVGLLSGIVWVVTLPYYHIIKPFFVGLEYGMVKSRLHRDQVMGCLGTLVVGCIVGMLVVICPPIGLLLIALWILNG